MWFSVPHLLLLLIFIVFFSRFPLVARGVMNNAGLISVLRFEVGAPNDGFVFNVPVEQSVSHRNLLF